MPAGVFNLVNGDGPGVSSVLSSPRRRHASFTGSTRAGTSVMQNAAVGIKKVALELGGKSPNIILDDADLKTAVARGMIHMAMNTGQSCNAPSRMLAPAKYKGRQSPPPPQLYQSAGAGSASWRWPLANANQFQVQPSFKGIDEGRALS